VADSQPVERPQEQAAPPIVRICTRQLGPHVCPSVILKRWDARGGAGRFPLISTHCAVAVERKDTDFAHRPRSSPTDIVDVIPAP